MARREGERGLRGVERGDHLVVARRHDLLARDPVHVASVHGRDDDLVADAELVDVEERLAVGRSMSCNRSVAELAGHRGLRVVPGALLQVGLLDAGDHDVVDADRRHLDAGDRITLLDHRLGGRRLAARDVRPCPAPCRASCAGTVSGDAVGDHLDVGRRRAGEELLEFVLQGVLGPGSLDPGAPQLVRHESEHEQARRDQRLAEPADPPPPVVARWRRWTVELADQCGPGLAVGSATSDTSIEASWHSTRRDRGWRTVSP